MHLFAYSRRVCYFCCHSIPVQGMKVFAIFLGMSLAQVSCRNESTSFLGSNTDYLG